jgi:uncharacterized protein YndB with AHSA1/START domain
MRAPWGCCGGGRLRAFGSTVFLATRRSVPGLIGATTLGTALSAVALLAFGWTRLLPVAMGAMVILGFGISVCNVGINMLLQSMAPDRLRGRIVSFFTSARFGFDALGGLLAGFIASAIGPGRTMILEGVVLLFVAFLASRRDTSDGRWRGTIQAGLRAVRPRRGHSIPTLSIVVSEGRPLFSGKHHDRDPYRHPAARSARPRNASTVPSSTPPRWSSGCRPMGTAQVHEMDARVGGKYRMSFTHFASGHSHAFGGTYLELQPGARISYSDAFDDPNLSGEMRTTVSLRAVSCGTELVVVQEGFRASFLRSCHLGWQESLILLAQLVEAEIPG